MLISARRGALYAILGGMAVIPSVATAQTAVPGYANPYLAGLPAGATASGGDTAPEHSPTLFTGATITSGVLLKFSATGSVSYNGGDLIDPPDGDALYVFSRGEENGMSGYTITVNSLVGVFLGPEQPDLSAAPGALDFGLPESRDYLSLSPELKQIFFIGDGRTSTNLEQQVIAPLGATRLFLGTADGEGWFNNTGSFTVAIPEPSSLFLIGTVALGLVRYGCRRKSGGGARSRGHGAV